MERLRDVFKARALAMVVIGQCGRHDVSQRRTIADCADGVVVTLDRLKRDWLTVRVRTEVVLAVDWHPFDSMSDIKHNISAFVPGTWEDVLYRLARPQLQLRDRWYWKRRKYWRQAGV